MTNERSKALMKIMAMGMVRFSRDAQAARASPDTAAWASASAATPAGF